MKIAPPPPRHASQFWEKISAHVQPRSPEGVFFRSKKGSPTRQNQAPTPQSLGTAAETVWNLLSKTTCDITCVVRKLLASMSCPMNRLATLVLRQPARACPISTCESPHQLLFLTYRVFPEENGTSVPCIVKKSRAWNLSLFVVMKGFGAPAPSSRCVIGELEYSMFFLAPLFVVRVN